MTKKDYKAFAMMLSDCPSFETKECLYIRKDTLVDMLCDYFSEENSRFKEGVFRKEAQ